MRERIGDRPLKQSFHLAVNRLQAGEIAIKGSERGEEPLLFLRPPQGCRIVPTLVAPYATQCPIKQVAHVSKYSCWSAARTGEISKIIRRPLEGSGGTVSKSGDCVAEKFAFRVHSVTISLPGMHQSASLIN